MKHEQITAWALKELSPEEAAQLEAQLQEDAATQQQAAQTKDFCDFLSAHLLDPHMALAPDQRASLQEAAVTSAAPAKKAQPLKTVPTSHRPWWQNPALSALAAAAVVALLATGAWFVLPSDHDKEQATPSLVASGGQNTPSAAKVKEHSSVAAEMSPLVLEDPVLEQLKSPEPINLAANSLPFGPLSLQPPEAPKSMLYLNGEHQSRYWFSSVYPYIVYPSAGTAESEFLTKPRLSLDPSKPVTSTTNIAAVTEAISTLHQVPGAAPGEVTLKPSKNELILGDSSQPTGMPGVASPNYVNSFLLPDAKPIDLTVNSLPFGPVPHGPPSPPQSLSYHPPGTTWSGLSPVARSGADYSELDLSTYPDLNEPILGDNSRGGGDLGNTSASTLTKSGAGNFILSGNNTYTAGTVVSGGVISGSGNIGANGGSGTISGNSGTIRGAWAVTADAPASSFANEGTAAAGATAGVSSPSNTPIIGALSRNRPDAAVVATSGSSPVNSPKPQIFDQAGAKLEAGHDTQLAAASPSPAATPAPMEALVRKVMSEPLPPGSPQPGHADKSAPAAATRSLALRSGGFHEEIIGFGDNEKDRGIRRRESIPQPNNESYTAIVENILQDVTRTPLSTFSIDVDTASYANVRRFLNQNTAPPPDAVRIEELINYFPTNAEGPGPDTKAPFAVGVEMAACPWQPQHRLARIAIKGRELGAAPKPSNLVFLVDVSGSMDEPNKLPLVQQSLRMLAEKLGEEDRVSMVVYAGSSGLVLPPTNGLEKAKILAAIDNLEAGGSTHGSSGIRLAYQQAVAGFIKGGVNRVILCTDGDFNVGISSPEELEKLITEKARRGVFLSVLGYGTGNLKDRTMETLADKGNGNYSYIDSLSEARKVLVEQMGGTLVTIAKDVKIQVEFNPRVIRAYRLIGYENRLLAKEDFNDDTKDAGEIGAGHSVTALYELVPANLPPGADPRGLVDDLKYQPKPAAAPPAPDPTLPAAGGKIPTEALTVKLRYKEPEGSTSQLIEVPVNDDDRRIDAASSEFKFTAAVAGFGLLLRHSSYSGALTWDHVRDLAQQGKGTDPHGYRGEFLQLLEKARGVTTR